MNTHPLIILEKGEHQKQAVIFVRFDFNRDSINRLIETTSVRWSNTTEIYTQVSESSLAKIKSPLDKIFEDKQKNYKNLPR